MSLKKQSSVAAGAAKSGPSLNDFTNTFVLSSAPSSRGGQDQQVLSEIPKALSGIDPSRQRRAHQKSRTGCENCRRRRIKCSEGNDGASCNSCSRRGERCQRPLRYNRGSSTPSIPKPVLNNPIPSFGPTDTVLNLDHLKLFHHFQTCTRHTLILNPEIWDYATQLSFQYDFLMYTILCVTARHLAFLRPEDITYPRTAASHLCRALPKFRHKLAENFSSTHIDAFMATSLLLQYEAWTSTDFSTDLDSTAAPFDPARDRVFAMGSCFKEVFLKSVPALCRQPSKFLPLLRCNPMDTLVPAARISNDTLAKYEDFFSYGRPVTLKLLEVPLSSPDSEDDLAASNLWQHRDCQAENQPEPGEDEFAPIVARLGLMLSFLPEAHPRDYSGPQSPLFIHLARYILSFPVMCHLAQQRRPGHFSAMVQQGDPHALSMLYHFYRAVRILLPSDNCWWAHRRATVFEINLREWLKRESTK
ncbi:hypothetical protein GGR53DRAFT_24198 [Hypoxylon sp. FL1150]|nr:hypothetical protein GGR53DRAFT_24198 [Hypoxylon sp. FL1150]